MAVCSKNTCVFLAALAMVVVIAVLVGCGSQQQTSSASSVSGQASSVASMPSSSSTETVGGEGVVTIALDRNAGTGFEWKCTMEPEGIVELVDQKTEDASSGGNVAGGPLSDRYTVRAVKPGEVTLTFNLVREWEGEPAQTQVYSFRVADDLGMVLNPYKSDFVNEPVWESNS